jgi:hypothetical protein
MSIANRNCRVEAEESRDAIFATEIPADLGGRRKALRQTLGRLLELAAVGMAAKPAMFDFVYVRTARGGFHETFRQVKYPPQITGSTQFGIGQWFQSLLPHINVPEGLRWYLIGGENATK